jgi:large conductance mechanosensitive channel
MQVIPSATSAMTIAATRRVARESGFVGGADVICRHFAHIRGSAVSSTHSNNNLGGAMGLAKEFKEFAMKGSVVDLAIGVIIGAAFGKIVSSLVEDIIMPPLGKVIGGVNFTDLAVSLGTDPAGKEVLWKYGNFLQISFQFLIVAFVLFMLIRTINKLKKPDPAAPPPAPPAQEVLLREIRDLLAKKA